MILQNSQGAILNTIAEVAIQKLAGQGVPLSPARQLLQGADYTGMPTSKLAGRGTSRSLRSNPRDVAGIADQIGAKLTRGGWLVAKPEAAARAEQIARLLDQKLRQSGLPRPKPKPKPKSEAEELADLKPGHGQAPSSKAKAADLAEAMTAKLSDRGIPLSRATGLLEKAQAAGIAGMLADKITGTGPLAKKVVKATGSKR